MDDYIITIHSRRISPETLEGLLAAELAQDSNISLEIRRSRALDPTVLIALIGLVGTGVGALVTGLLNIAAKDGESKIVLQGQTGRRVEIPANTPTDRLAEYIELAKQLDVDRIEII